MAKTPQKPGRHPVTSKPERLALLIPVLRENEADGEVISGSEVGTSWARRFSDEDAKRVKQSLPEGDFRRFAGLVYAKQAIKDPPMLEEALKRLMRSYRDTESELAQRLGQLLEQPFALEVGRNIAPRLGLSPEDSYRHLIGLHVGPRAREDAERLLAYEVGRVLATTMNVMWRVNGEMWPAIYCLNEKTALYAHKFVFAATGGRSWCVCPWCREPFFQKRPLDIYCTKTCRVDAKKARSRDRARSQQAGD
jgi:hypothetical protein